jgi:hypothetical protein
LRYLKWKGNMMSDWKITGKATSSNPVDIWMGAIGVPVPTEYEVTNEETGDVKDSLALSEDELGRNIERGDLRD